MLARFCPEPYHPFDPENIGKYVVDETHKLINTITPFKETLNLNKTFKSSFDTFFKSEGFDAVKIWKQIDDIIVALIFDNEEKLICFDD